MSTPLSKIRGFFEIDCFKSTFLKQYMLGPKSKSNFPKMGNFLRPGNPDFYIFYIYSGLPGGQSQISQKWEISSELVTLLMRKQMPGGVAIRR